MRQHVKYRRGTQLKEFPVGGSNFQLESELLLRKNSHGTHLRRRQGPVVYVPLNRLRIVLHHVLKISWGEVPYDYKCIHM